MAIGFMTLGYKKWYSPEEFKHIFSYANANDEFVNALQIRHPKDGIEAGFKRLNELGERLRIFSLKVAEYYNKLWSSSSRLVHPSGV